MDPRRLQGLARIAEAKKDLELMALSALTRERVAITARRQALDRSVIEAHDTVTHAPGEGALSVLSSFDRYVAGRRTELERQARDVEAAWSDQGRLARNAFARCSALSRLREEAQARLRRARAERARREGV